VGVRREAIFQCGSTGQPQRRLTATKRIGAVLREVV
jgi:hypothetical protein